MPSRARRRARLLALLFLLAVATLVFERWRGERALLAWKSKRIEQGEIFDPNKLWPPASTGSIEFSNQLAQALQELPPVLRSYAGLLSGMVQHENGLARRGSQQPRPPLGYQREAHNTWEELDAGVRQARPALQAIHRLMKAPPLDMGYNIAERLGDVSFPNFVNVRIGAQSLQAAAISELHQGNLAGALDDLESLLAFGRLYGQDPTLVNFMIRVATTGLSVNVCWDALQDPGWTEPQLIRIQQACAANVLLPHMPRALEAERIARHHDLSWFRSHSYEDWIARYQPVFQSFGSKPPAQHVASPVRFWRQWVFHPAWCFAWVDQEELLYLRQSESELVALRQATNHQSWQQLKQELKASYQGCLPPAAAWRFYCKLPISGDLAEVLGSSSSIVRPTYPYPDYSKAWLATFKNLTQYQMMITAVAIKRYGLRYGKMPTNLALLVPSHYGFCSTRLHERRSTALPPECGRFIYSLFSRGERFGRRRKPIP